MKLSKALQYASLYIIGLLLIGFASAFVGSKPYVFWKETAWYLNNVLTYTAIILVTIATYMLVTDRKKETNEEYVAAKKEISTFARTTYRPTLFKRFAKAKNRERKIDQYLANLQIELVNLENKASDTDEGTRVNGTEAEKSKNAYCVKHAVLERKMAKEYYEDHIDKINVNYDAIDSDVVFGAPPKKAKKAKVNPYVTRGRMGKLAVAKLPGLLISFAIMCFASAIIIELAFSPTAWINIGVKVLSLLWNSIQTIDYANAMFEINELNDVRFCLGIVKEFDVWAANELKLQEAKNNDGHRDSPAADGSSAKGDNGTVVVGTNPAPKDPVHLQATPN